MCCKTGKFKVFRSKSSQSSQTEKTSIAPYRHVGTEAQKGRNKVVKLTQRQHEVTDLQSGKTTAQAWNFINFWLHNLGKVFIFLFPFYIYRLGGKDNTYLAPSLLKPL